MEKEEILKQAEKKFQDNLTKYKTYTWEELRKFEELGIRGEVCMCKMKIANTMTIECVICGKVQPQYARAFVRRKSEIKTEPNKAQEG